jgi:nitroreductase
LKNSSIFLLIIIVHDNKDNLDFDDVVRKRKMIRQYERQIPDEIVMKLIKNAHRAPSAGHTQVQEFVIVKNPTKKRN